MSNKAISVYAEALKRQQTEEEQQISTGIASKTTQKSARPRAVPRDGSSDSSREKLRGNPTDLPSRDEIQEFSFRLRDELKVKVQAEVPHQWQKELEEIARKLDVRKLELYRFIIGEFLGRVRQKKTA